MYICKVEVSENSTVFNPKARITYRNTISFHITCPCGPLLTKNFCVLNTNFYNILKSSKPKNTEVYLFTLSVFVHIPFSLLEICTMTLGLAKDMQNQVYSD